MVAWWCCERHSVSVSSFERESREYSTIKRQNGHIFSEIAVLWPHIAAGTVERYRKLESPAMDTPMLLHTTVSRCQYLPRCCVALTAARLNAALSAAHLPLPFCLRSNHPHQSIDPGTAGHAHPHRTLHLQAAMSSSVSMHPRLVPSSGLGVLHASPALRWLLVMPVEQRAQHTALERKEEVEEAGGLADW